MVIVIRLVFENVLSPIFINVDGNEILVNNLQLLNVSFPIDVIPSGIIHFPYFMLICISLTCSVNMK